jgi:hypothetical protein
MHLGGQGLQQRAWVLGESYVSSASRAILTAARAAPLASKAERKADNNVLGSASRRFGAAGSLMHVRSRVSTQGTRSEKP